MAEQEWTLRGRWVFPGCGPPLEDGLITVRGERIVAVSPVRQRSVDVDLGQVALLPGLVNAHTHLDLSGLRGHAPPGGCFPDWLRQVIAARRQTTPEQIETAIALGITESLASGVTLLADIASLGASWAALAGASLRSVVQYELLGLPAPRAHQAWAGFLDWLRAHPATDRCRPGISPHAPYSVRRGLFRASASLAQARALALTIHLAETREEVELLREHGGAFRTFLQDLGVWDEAGLVHGVADLLGLMGGQRRVLLAHGNFLEASQVPPGSTVVYCPRTHAAFGHPPHPFRALLAAGVPVALGTDSLASNPDLDVLAEARFLQRLAPEVSGARLLRMITRTGAEALGWDDEVGTLEAGKSADVVVLPVPEERAHDPHDLVFAAQTRVEAVLWRGQWVYKRAEPKK